MSERLDRTRARAFDDAAHIIGPYADVTSAQRRLVEVAAELRGDPPDEVVDMAEQKRRGAEKAEVRRALRSTYPLLAEARARSHAVGHRDPELRAAVRAHRVWLMQLVTHAKTLGLTNE